MFIVLAVVTSLALWFVYTERVRRFSFTAAAACLLAEAVVLALLAPTW